MGAWGLGSGEAGNYGTLELRNFGTFKAETKIIIWCFKKHLYFCTSKIKMR